MSFIQRLKIQSIASVGNTLSRFDTLRRLLGGASVVMVILMLTCSVTSSLPNSNTVTSRWLQPCHVYDSTSLFQPPERRISKYSPRWPHSSKASNSHLESRPPSSSSSLSANSILGLAPTSWLFGKSKSQQIGYEAVNIPAVFRLLSEKIMKLKQRVRELKNLYVNHRFRDSSILEDIDQMGVKLSGMPQVEESTVESVNNADLTEIVHRAFEQLSRVAVFIDQARLGERMAANEKENFEKHFERIEDHEDYGLYWIMCAVQQVIHHIGENTQTKAVLDILNMKVAEVDKNAMRHTRDYLILRDFEKLLTRLSIDFASLKELSVL